LAAAGLVVVVRGGDALLVHGFHLLLLLHEQTDIHETVSYC